ncbi:MAG: hypothetical protein RMN25_11625 [Anaerolineae bacterium]|nr:hypothetical protein [Thermoflexales bacterium]MDW8408418.1 hypothetical protein [Anaerolineae bacterium]
MTESAPASTLSLEYKPDASTVVERMAAWWEGEIVDRATILLSAPKPNPQPLPHKQHATLRERWMDIDFQVECAAIHAANTYWAGESLPIYMPNLGPEILTACYGAELQFTENTSWSEPILQDWADMSRLRIDPDNEYLRCILEMTRRALEVGRGKFLVGLTDIHPGGDLAASLRDPQQLCLDLVEAPDQVRGLLQHIYPAFFDFFKLNHHLIRAAGQTICTSWLPLFVDGGRYYIPSNDFSIMISTEMFETFFLPELLAEIAWLDHSIYHLDGPGALRHLDLLLDIPKLDAIQFVYGDGAKPASRWIQVFQKIQNAGKNVHISIEPHELDFFMDNLNPEGVMVQTSVASAEEADAMIAQIAKWTRKGKH